MGVLAVGRSDFEAVGFCPALFLSRLAGLSDT
jgi:hypothetical protein